MALSGCSDSDEADDSLTHSVKINTSNCVDNQSSAFKHLREPNGGRQKKKVMLWVTLSSPLNVCHVSLDLFIDSHWGRLPCFAKVPARLLESPKFISHTQTFALEVKHFPGAVLELPCFHLSLFFFWHPSLISHEDEGRNVCALGLLPLLELVLTSWLC